MLPINPKQTYKHTDTETGVVYEFRYLLGSMQEKFNEIVKFASNNIKQADLLKKKTDGKTEEQFQEMRDEIDKEQAELTNNLMKYYKSLIDFFLCNWTSEKVELPAFPDHPSDLFVPEDINKMGGITQGLIPILTRAPEYTLKN